MKALVLGGGSIKGSFQAGAIDTLLKAGFKPSKIFGVSVGSLNGVFLADRTGRYKSQGKEPDWPAIGDELVNFWLDNIDDFSKIGEKRSGTGTLFEVIFNDFDGLIDTTNLQNLVKATFQTNNLKRSPVQFYAGYVNVANGQFYNADLGDPDIIDYIIASTAIPILMPIKKINDTFLVDGGLRNVSPLKYAFQDKNVNAVVAITCQGADFPPVSVNYENLVTYAERVMDIIVNGIITNDLEWADYINFYCPKDGSMVTEGPLTGYRYAPIGQIRPKRDPDINLENFNRDDIRKQIEYGQNTAQQALKEGVFQEILSLPD
jgi:NTE family protein